MKRFYRRLGYFLFGKAVENYLRLLADDALIGCPQGSSGYEVGCALHTAANSVRAWFRCCELIGTPGHLFYPKGKS